MSLSGLKDVDREILKHIDDESLLKICSLDRKTWNQVCDDNFLKRRLSKYPGIEKYKNQKESWKEFFLQVIYYTSKMKEEFQYEYKSGDFKRQFNLLNKDKGETRLYRNAVLLDRAVGEGELDLVKYAVNNGASITAYGGNGALRKAAAKGYLDMVKFLVEKGADIHQNILQYAADGCHLSVVKYLVENGVRTENILQFSGNLQVAEYLVEHGANIVTEKDDALKYAAFKGRLEFLRWLIDNGANIRVYGDYPLRAAASQGHFEVVKYLVENGADVHAGQDDALSAASEKGYLEIVKYLVEHGAKHINKALKQAQKNKHKEIVQYLKRLV